MPRSIPDDEVRFDELMKMVDRRLVKSGYEIPQRPIMALNEVSKLYSMTLLVTEPPEGARFEGTDTWPVTSRIYQWYESRYGERLNLGDAPGRMVILIEEDQWVLRFPRIYGAVNFIVSHTHQSSRTPSSSGSVVFNVVDAVEKMPRERIPSLPDTELEHIFEKFILGVQAFSLLEGTTSKHGLIRSAIADIRASVEHLMATHAQYGLSKWSSLQAAEKVLKATIEMAGGTYSSTHVLQKLTKQAVAAGLVDHWSILLPYIQCSPGIRYGAEPCTRDEALVAHHASLMLMLLLQQGGADFSSRLTPLSFGE